MAARTFLAWQPSLAPTPSKPRASAPVEVINLSDDESCTSSNARSGMVAPVQRTASSEAERKSSTSSRWASDVATSPAGSAPPLTSSRSDSRISSAGHSKDDFEDIDSVLLAIDGGETADQGAGVLHGGTVKDQHRGHAEAPSSQGLRKPKAYVASAPTDSEFNTDTDSRSSFDASQCGKCSDRQWPISRICGVRMHRGRKLYLVRWVDTEEPEEELGNARELIAEFEKRRKARRNERAMPSTRSYSGVKKTPKSRRVQFTA